MAESRRLAIVATHPIQYYAPWYRALAARPELDLTVYYCHQQTAAGQAAAGFGIAFDWDVPLLVGYRYEFLENVAKLTSTATFRGCDTPAIADRIADNNFDAVLVHGWSTKSYWQAMRACWRRGVPLMVRGDSQLLTPRSLVKRCVKAVAYPRFIPRFDAYLVVGQRAREYYLAYGADPQRMFDCPHFVDNERFAAQAAELRPRRSELRRQWGIPEDAFCVLFCGKFIALKRPFDLIQAAVQAEAGRGVGRPIHLLFVGSGELGVDMRRACRVVHDSEDLAAGLPNVSGPRTTFAGFVNQSKIAAAYVAADTLALTSDSETWGLTVNEAMACGIPAIVSDGVGCAPDLVRDGETGFIFACGDVRQLGRIIASVAADARLTERLAAGARARVAQYAIGAAADGAVAAVRYVSGVRSCPSAPQTSEAAC